MTETRETKIRERFDDRWIPVKERVPQINICVLTFHDDDSIETNYYLPSGNWQQRFGWKNITHWMPLPDPPRSLSSRKAGSDD